MKIMNNKKIVIIVVSAIIVIAMGIVLSAGSMILDSPVLVILATLDFIGTEQEFRNLVESTEEAKLFRETFPNSTTQYYLEIGKRTLIFENKITAYDATIHFVQLYDRTLFISYWCDKGNESLFGHVDNVDELKESGCY